MTNQLLFDFKTDKTAKKVIITREFDAELTLVWDAFTKQELLDQWTAPAPWVAKTKYMNFEVGGKRFYAMVSPDGIERWSIQRYTSITPLPGSEWDYQFSEQNARLHNHVSRPITKVVITIYNESFERMEKLLEGFQQGYTMTLNMLEHLLADLSKPQIK
jgi:uncharacterized protein YndB with AHSA1/START domain